MLARALFAVAVAASAAAFSAPRVAADPSGTCPDQFVPVLVIVDPADAKKDRNGDFVICGKVGPDGEFHAGPDDTVQDNIII